MRDWIHWGRPRWVATLIAGACLASAGLRADLRIDLVSQEGAAAYASYRHPLAGRYGTRHPDDLGRLIDIHCNSGVEVAVQPDYVLVPVGCDMLRWNFGLSSYEPGKATAFSRTSWHSATGGWWLVQEGASLLRPAASLAKGEDSVASLGGHSVAFHLDGQPLPIRAGPKAMPSMHEAPAFWLLGNPISVVQGDVRHFFDLGVVPAHMKTVLDRHQDAVASLRASLPVRALSPVFWMGAAGEAGEIGGAAGTGLIIASYPLSADQFGEATLALTLYVAVHEHAHQMFDAKGVLWIAESVASYLALRAVQDSAPSLFPHLESALLVPGKEAAAPLQDLGARAEAEGEAYAMLYSVGAAFWWDLDTLLRRQDVNLLDVLPRLLANGFSPDGRPVADAIAGIVAVSANDVQSVLARYFK